MFNFCSQFVLMGNISYWMNTPANALIRTNRQISLNSLTPFISLNRNLFRWFSMVTRVKLSFPTWWEQSLSSFLKKFVKGLQVAGSSSSTKPPRFSPVPYILSSFPNFSHGCTCCHGRYSPKREISIKLSESETDSMKHSLCYNPHWIVKRPLDRTHSRK